MRITGGLYKGRQVKMPKGVLRPAMDRMRESMFAILGNLQDDSFLDLFSGSGIVGLEAASRGCNRVVLVEKDKLKKPVLHQNMAIVQPTCRISLALMAVESYIKTANLNGVNRFDFIHLDPPFPLKNKETFLQLIVQYQLLKEGGTLTLHYPKEDVLATEIGSLQQYDLRHYGRSTLAFYTIS